MILSYILTLLLFSHALTLSQKNVGPWNIRGYVHYPAIEDLALNPLQFEVTFDYDQELISYGSKVEIICYGYERNISKCSENVHSEDVESTRGQPVWSANTTTIVKPYNKIIFTTSANVDLYECRGRLIDFGDWSDLVLIPLKNCSFLKPKPRLLVTHSMQDPTTSYTERYLIRKFDAQSANGPNETMDAEFTKRWHLAYNGMGTYTTWFGPFCFDWIGHWQYRITPNETCLIVVDMLFSSLPVYPINANCKKDVVINDILCYSIRNLVFFTTRHKNSSKGDWSLVEYDHNTKSTRVLVGLNSKVKSCSNLLLSHPKLILDWRLYWTIGTRSEEDPRVVFVSKGFLWTYSISGQLCEKLIKLQDIGVANISKVVKFAMDWDYFYWIDKTTRSLKSFSFESQLISNITNVQVYGVEMTLLTKNVSRKITEDMPYVMDITTYSRAERPFPHPQQCLIPTIDMTIRMNSKTTASIGFKKVWNTSDICKRISQPPIQVVLDCRPLSAGVPNCTFVEYSKRSRRSEYSVEVQHLVLGIEYQITVSTSFWDVLDTENVTTKTFLAALPEDLTVKISVPVAVASALILITSTFAFWRIYKRRRHLKYIGTDQLDILDQLGEGHFSKVVKVVYYPQGKKPKLRRLSFINSWKPRPANADNLSLETIEAAAKVLGGKHRSANCFVDEMIMLTVLNHINIIKAYGICQNFPYTTDEAEQSYASTSEPAPLAPEDYTSNGIPYTNGVTANSKSKTDTRALILEYMNIGCLTDYIRKFRRQIKNQDLLFILQNVVEGFSYLNDQKIVHRDLAPRNVLVRVAIENGQTTARVLGAKVADFGLAKTANYRTQEGFWAYKGSEEEEKVPWRIMSPEAFDHIFSTHSDTWAFAILIWEIYTFITDGSAKPYDDLLVSNESDNSETSDFQSNGDSNSGHNGTSAVCEVYSAKTVWKKSKISADNTAKNEKSYLSDTRSLVKGKTDNWMAKLKSKENNTKRKQNPLMDTVSSHVVPIAPNSESSYQDSNLENELSSKINKNELPVFQFSETNQQIFTPVHEDFSKMQKLSLKDKIREHLQKGKSNPDFIPLSKPKAASWKVYEIMQQCWAYNAMERLTFKQLSRPLSLLIKEEQRKKEVKPLIVNCNIENSLEVIEESDEPRVAELSTEIDCFADRSVESAIEVAVTLVDVHKNTGSDAAECVLLSV